MTNFNVGDKVRYKGNPGPDSPETHVEYLVGHVGTVISKDSNYGVQWDAPYPEMDWSPRYGEKVVTWPQYFSVDTDTIFELVEAAQPDAVDLLKGAGFYEAANYLNAVLNPPEKRTVLVEFEVEDGAQGETFKEELFDFYSESVTILNYTVKEDSNE